MLGFAFSILRVILKHLFDMLRVSNENRKHQFTQREGGFNKEQLCKGQPRGSQRDSHSLSVISQDTRVTQNYMATSVIMEATFITWHDLVHIETA